MLEFLDLYKSQAPTYSFTKYSALFPPLSWLFSGALWSCRWSANRLLDLQRLVSGLLRVWRGCDDWLPGSFRVYPCPRRFSKLCYFQRCLFLSLSSFCHRYLSIFWVSSFLLRAGPSFEHLRSSQSKKLWPTSAVVFHRLAFESPYLRIRVFHEARKFRFCSGFKILLHSSQLRVLCVRRSNRPKFAPIGLFWKASLQSRCWSVKYFPFDTRLSGTLEHPSASQSLKARHRDLRSTLGSSCCQHLESCSSRRGEAAFFSELLRA